MAIKNNRTWPMTDLQKYKKKLLNKPEYKAYLVAATILTNNYIFSNILSTIPYCTASVAFIQ